MNGMGGMNDGMDDGARSSAVALQRPKRPGRFEAGQCHGKRRFAQHCLRQKKVEAGGAGGGGGGGGVGGGGAEEDGEASERGNSEVNRVDQSWPTQSFSKDTKAWTRAWNKLQPDEQANYQRGGKHFKMFEAEHSERMRMYEVDCKAYEKQEESESKDDDGKNYSNNVLSNLVRDSLSKCILWSRARNRTSANPALASAMRSAVRTACGGTASTATMGSVAAIAIQGSRVKLECVRAENSVHKTASRIATMRGESMRNLDRESRKQWEAEHVTSNAGGRGGADAGARVAGSALARLAQLGIDMGVYYFDDATSTWHEGDFYNHAAFKEPQLQDSVPAMAPHQIFGLLFEEALVLGVLPVGVLCTPSCAFGVKTHVRY
jgi:hypothetical protein